MFVLNEKINTKWSSSLSSFSKKLKRVRQRLHKEKVQKKTQFETFFLKKTNNENLKQETPKDSSANFFHLEHFLAFKILLYWSQAAHVSSFFKAAGVLFKILVYSQISFLLFYDWA